MLSDDVFHRIGVSNLFLLSQQKNVDATEKIDFDQMTYHSVILIRQFLSLNVQQNLGRHFSVKIYFFKYMIAL